MQILFKNKPVNLSPVQILVLSFFTLIVIGTFLLSLPAAVKESSKIDILTSLFTATSAVCVTGLVVVDTGTHWSFFGQMVIFLLIQAGGLGIMTSAAIFILLWGKKIGLKQRLVIQQSLNLNTLGGVVRILKQVFLFSLTVELLAAVILAARWVQDFGWGKSIWFGIFHAVSAFNNAGFDLIGNFKSLTGYVEDITVNLTVMALIAMGGLGYTTINDVANRFWLNPKASNSELKGFRYLTLHSKIVLSFTAVLIVLGAAVIYLLESQNALQQLSPQGKIMASFFHAVTPRTAGFSTLDLNSLTLTTQLFTMLLMFIGASPGSTGGGAKTTNIAVLVLVFWSTIRGQEAPSAFGRRISMRQVYKSLTVFLLAISVIAAGTITLSLTENADLTAILFETISALGIVGLSLGLTTKLSAAGQILIIIIMFLGRLGPLTVALAFAQKAHKERLKYPKGEILIG